MANSRIIVYFCIKMAFQSGFVSIIGLPNAGKSTLYNALMEEKLSIVNKKAQTTRHRILGIKNGENSQIIYSDTPGVLRKISYKMHEHMMTSIHQTFEDSDVLIYLWDATKKFEAEDLQEKFNQSKAKKIVAINKLDLLNELKLEQVDAHIKEHLQADVYLPISAKENFHLDILEKWILKFLPEHPAYFPEGQLSDRSERFFVNEIIRNNVLELYSDEIPYSVEVSTLQFKEDTKIIRITSEIIAERESQKGILVGPKGSAIKQLGIRSRKELEEFFQKQIYIELYVKVRDNWRNNKNMLKQFGYDEG